MVCKLCHNKSVINKILSHFPDSYCTTYKYIQLGTNFCFFVCRPEGTDLTISEADFDLGSFKVVFKFMYF